MTAVGAPELIEPARGDGAKAEDAAWSPAQEAVDPRALSWPSSRLGSLVGICALFTAMTLPVVLSDASEASLFLALPAIAVIVVVARWLSHSSVLGTTPRDTVRRAAGEAPAALSVTVMLALVCFIAGVPVHVDGVALTGVLVLAALTLAATSAALETRMLLERRRVFFVGSSEHRNRLARELIRRSDMRLVGALTMPVVCDPSVLDRQVVSGASSADATMVVVDQRAMREEPVLAALGELHHLGRRVRTLAGFYEEALHKVALDELSPEWFLSDIAELHDPGVYGRMKRVTEFLVAGLVLVVTAPIIPVVAILVRSSSRGPVFFRQERVGRDGALFRVTKFRTMNDCSSAPQRWASDDQARVTSVGRFLRRFRLDELPQLVSVLRGDMSLVGPRPEQPELVERLEREIPYYGARHGVRPGITGWAQVNAGYCGGVDGGRRKLSYDLYYVGHQSLRLDLAIIAATGRAMLRGSGA